MSLTLSATTLKFFIKNSCFFFGRMKTVNLDGGLKMSFLND
jgi:hypothetical protein